MISTTDLSATPGAPPGVHRVRPRHHPLLGGLLVKEGLINRVQLERMLTLQEEMEPRPLLGQILLDQKLITPHELHVVLGKYHKEYRLGDVLVETHAITSKQLEGALAHQRKTDAPLGDALIQLGLITERQLKQALSIQLRITFVDLDDWSMDPSLTSVISERYARHHRVIPVARTDDRIVLAMDDPTDVEVIAELASCTGHRIDVVTATADALGRAFSRLYGARADVESVPASRTDGGEASGGTDRRRAARPRPGAALDAIRARVEALRHIVPTWEQLIDAVETLLRERLERRAEIEHLAGELRENRTAHARTSQDLEAKAQALTRLEMAHAALLEERDALRRSLGELRERNNALVRSHHSAIDHLDAILRRLRPGP